MLRRPVSRLVAVLAAALTLLFLLPAPAQAHAYLVRTDPGDGTTLEHAPRTLTLSFSEHVVLDATRIEIVDGDGRSIPVSDLRIDTTDTTDTEAPAAITASLTDLPVNTYRVSWETLSSDDLHATSGFFVFGVGRTVQAGGFVEPVPRVEESTLRWLLLLGIALVLGSAFLGRLLDGQQALPGSRRRLAGLAWIGSLGAVLTSIVLLLNQLTPTGLTLPRLLGSGYGARWAWRETGLVVLAVSALLGLRGTSRSRQRALLVVGAALTVTGTAALGHAGASPGATRLLATSAHILAVTTWAGGVLCVLALVAPAAHREPGRVVALRGVLRSFAVPAAACASVAVVTGVYLSSTVVVSIDALIATTYGRVLLTKVGLVALMGVAGLVNHRRLRGRHDLDVPRRTVAVEAMLGVLALAAAGVLASGQPATEPEFLVSPTATRGPLTSQVGDLQEGVSLRPNVPGRNVAAIDVYDTRRPSPGTVTGVDLEINGSTVATASLGDGHWTVPLGDVPAGRVTLTVTVHRDGLRDTTWRQPWVVGRSTPDRQPVVSTAPVSDLLRWTAGGLAVLVAGGWAWSLGRRRRAGRPEPSQPEVETVSSSA